MTKSERRLVLLLRAGSVLLLSALGAVVMPFSWMDEIHAWLGLGALPDLPIVGYLTRSLSALYAVHGALLLYVSLDARRHLGVVRFLGAATVIFGVGMIPLDLAVGLPLYWVLGEGPFVIVLGAALLALVAAVKREQEKDTST